MRQFTQPIWKFRPLMWTENSTLRARVAQFRMSTKISTAFAILLLFQEKNANCIFASRICFDNLLHHVALVAKQPKWQRYLHSFLLTDRSLWMRKCAQKNSKIKNYMGIHLKIKNAPPKRTDLIQYSIHISLQNQPCFRFPSNNYTRNKSVANYWFPKFHHFFLQSHAPRRNRWP